MISNTGNETLDQSINAISNFAQRVHNSISYLHTSIQDNFDQHTDIYEKITYLDNAREDIYNKIGEISNKDCSFSCIEDPDGNILTLQINSE